jgi:hypothetical protein
MPRRGNVADLEFPKRPFVTPAWGRDTGLTGWIRKELAGYCQLGYKRRRRERRYFYTDLSLGGRRKMVCSPRVWPRRKRSVSNSVKPFAQLTQRA